MAGISLRPTPALPETVAAFLALQARLERTGKAGLDFSMQYLHYLCLKDIEDCHLLLDSLVSDDKEVEKTKTNNYKLFGFVPRYGYLITFIPFFPAMFLFTGSGGLAFFITAISEMVLRMLWPDFRTEMLGKIWISFTFLIFTPSLLYLLYRIVETLMTNI